MLSERQKAQFHSDGFIVIERAVDAADIASIRAAAHRLVADFDPTRNKSVFSTRDNDAGRDRYFMESAEAVRCFLEADALDEGGNLCVDKMRAINKIGHALHDLAPEFNAFCRLPVFAGILRDLAVSAPQLWQTMYIFKQPGIGGEVRWHQDASYLITEPRGVTGFWVAVDDARLDNGCLWMQPGGHRAPLREIYEVDSQSGLAALRKLDATPWPDTASAVAIEVPSGSIVVFSDMMPHYSAHNASNRSRHAFTLHAAAATARWSRRNWLQRPTLGAFLL